MTLEVTKQSPGSEIKWMEGGSPSSRVDICRKIETLLVINPSYQRSVAFLFDHYVCPYGYIGGALSLF